ncbi:MAG: UDP-4-amino-4,6-dideoxy-N-acetyl-beta-L-altrosamine transaminase, partial [Candidatus Peribacteraceae bacterium]|nr:UDP-4-amino-4,6-dideoxy-N-acetyl-beta-L-altrosamine transaminase [Candidatus Peribacteraceae bacterium]
MTPLALSGGPPVRTTLLPYARQTVDEDDIQTVEAVLRSDWLTTGPKVEEFEKAFAAFTGTQEAVAVSNGTAALHAAYAAAGIGPGDEVIVPAMTFAATANAAVFLGARPVFADVHPETLLLDPVCVEARITNATKAIVAVDYAGQPCDYAALRTLAQKHHLVLLADACHALGATYGTAKVGTLADFSTFSFHAVKPLATGEGGMITTDDIDAAGRMRRLRNHGLTSDHRERQERGSWLYEMEQVGWNERLSDIHCALGISQLKKVPTWTKRRQSIARMYDEAFASLAAVTSLGKRAGLTHAYHLYVVRLDPKRLSANRKVIFEALRAEGIGVNVHYIPVHLLAYYRRDQGTSEGLCPVAEAAYQQIVSLPSFAGMTA